MVDGKTSGEKRNWSLPTLDLGVILEYEVIHWEKRGVFKDLCRRLLLLRRRFWAK